MTAISFSLDGAISLSLGTWSLSENTGLSCRTTVLGVIVLFLRFSMKMTTADMMARAAIAPMTEPATIGDAELELAAQVPIPK